MFYACCNYPTDTLLVKLGCLKLATFCADTEPPGRFSGANQCQTLPLSSPQPPV